MKIIRYKIVNCRVNRGSELNPQYEDILLEKQIYCEDALLDSNLEIAKTEAYKGEYTVEEV